MQDQDQNNLGHEELNKNISDIRKTLTNKRNSFQQQHTSTIKRTSQLVSEQDQIKILQERFEQEQQIQNQPEETFQELIDGFIFIKYGLKSIMGPTKRFIYITPDLEFFCWSERKGDKPSKKLKITDITSIQEGKQSVNFQYYKEKGNPDRCFQNNNRSVDIESFDDQTKQIFLEKLRKLVQKKDPQYKDQKQDNKNKSELIVKSEFTKSQKKHSINRKCPDILIEEEQSIISDQQEQE